MSNKAAVIIKGEDRELTLFVSDSDGNKIDLSSLTGAEARLKKQDNSFLSKVLGVGSIEIVSAPNGKLKLIINDTETATLKEGELQTFSLRLDFGTTRRICKFTKAITVESET